MHGETLKHHMCFMNEHVVWGMVINLYITVDR